MNDIEKKPAFVAELAAMTDEQLFEAAKKWIWLSAFANNNPRSAYHWMCDATYDESAKRAGVTPEDGIGAAVETIYGRAHKAAMRDAGYGN